MGFTPCVCDQRTEEGNEAESFAVRTTAQNTLPCSLCLSPSSSSSRDEAIQTQAHTRCPATQSLSLSLSVPRADRAFCLTHSLTHSLSFFLFIQCPSHVRFPVGDMEQEGRCSKSHGGSRSPAWTGVGEREHGDGYNGSCKSKDRLVSLTGSLLLRPLSLTLSPLFTGSAFTGLVTACD